MHSVQDIVGSGVAVNVDISYQGAQTSAEATDENEGCIRESAC